MSGGICEYHWWVSLVFGCRNWNAGDRCQWWSVVSLTIYREIWWANHGQFMGVIDHDDSGDDVWSMRTISMSSNAKWGGDVVNINRWLSCCLMHAAVYLCTCVWHRTSRLLCGLPVGGRCIVLLDPSWMPHINIQREWRTLVHKFIFGCLTNY